MYDNNNTNHDEIRNIDAELDKAISDALDKSGIEEEIKDALNEEIPETPETPKPEVDTDALLKAIKDGIKESFGAANILMKESFGSAKSGIRDIAHSVKDKWTAMQDTFDSDDGEDLFEPIDDAEESPAPAAPAKAPAASDTAGETSADGSALTLAYITSRLDLIMKDTQYLKDACDSVLNMNVNECPNGGTGDAKRAEAIQKAVEGREQTNQKILELLNKMYEDVMAPVREAEPVDARLLFDKKVDSIIQSHDMDGDEKINLIRALADSYQKL